MRIKTRAKRSINQGGGDEGTSSSSEEPMLGSLIWVKLDGDSWWPAQVVGEDSVSKSNKLDGKLPGEVLVRLYGSYQYLYADPVRCLSEFETVLQHNNGSYLDLFQRALEQDVPTSKPGRAKVGSAHKGKAKTETVVSKGVDSSRMRAQENLDLKDATVRRAATATPEMAVKRKARTLRSNRQVSSSDELEIIEDIEIPPESVSHGLKSSSRTAAQKARARISQQAQEVSEQEGPEKRCSPRKGQISVEDKKATAENGGGQKKGRSSTVRTNETLKEKQSEQDNSKKQKISSVEKEGKLEVPNLAQSVKKEKPAPYLRVNTEQLSSRRMRVMKNLGLVGPSGSPFLKNCSMLSSD